MEFRTVEGTWYSQNIAEIDHPDRAAAVEGRNKINFSCQLHYMKPGMMIIYESRWWWRLGVNGMNVIVLGPHAGADLADKRHLATSCISGQPHLLAELFSPHQ